MAETETAPAPDLSPTFGPCAAPSSPSSLNAEELGDTELELLEAEESLEAERLRRQVAELMAEERRHEAKRRRLAREVLRRRFAASTFGRLPADPVLQCLDAADVLRWAASSSAARAQLCEAPPVEKRAMDAEGKPAEMLRWRRPLAHLHGVSADMPPAAAVAFVAGLRWACVQTLSIDLASAGWLRLLEALAAADARGEAPEMPRLRGVSVAFPAERSSQARQTWQAAAPLLLQLAGFASGAPLQELVLDDLRSIDLLEAIFQNAGSQLRVCRASFIGPESRKRPLELPAVGLPSLRCLLIRYRDFCEQRASRQERMTVSAQSLLACLRSIDAPEKLRILGLGGIRVDGNRQDTAALLRVLPSFSGLVAVALRFSIPGTYGELISLEALLRLRLAWPLLGYFALGDMSMHGFDYWPEQITGFRNLYAHGQMPTAKEVFNNEFRYVISTQYGSSVERQWTLLEPAKRSFWAEVARRLPSMPHSELRQRAAALGPLNF